MIVKIKNVTQAMSVQQKMYFMFYMMDESVRMMKLRGTNKIVVIWDREGYRISSSSIKDTWRSKIMINIFLMKWNLTLTHSEIMPPRV